MDYGYVPDRDPYLNRLRVVVDRRPNTAMVSVRSVRSLQAFIQHLDRASSVTRPIDHMVVGGHANRWAWQVNLYGASQGTTFETIVDSMAVPANSIVVPDAVIGFVPDQPNPSEHFFHIKGCNLGKAPAFLEKLSEGLGGRLKITAPKHFHGASTHGRHLFEWMAYEFVIFQKSRLTTRAALAAAYHAAPLVLIDGRTKVPEAMWDRWLSRFRNINRTQSVPVWSRLGVSLGRRGRVETATVLTATSPTLVRRSVRYPSEADIPTDLNERMAELRRQLLLIAMYEDTHPFPMFKRLGYASFEDMIDGLDWKIFTSRQGVWHLLHFAGSRYEYQLMVPIMDQSGSLEPHLGTMIFNHWPATGSSVSRGIVESDSAFFATVP